MSNFRHLRDSVGWRLFCPPDRRSAWSCDVVIPCIEKDLPTLALCLPAVRRRLKHPISTIFVVSPPSRALEELAAKHGAVFVEESAFMGFGPRDLPAGPGPDRRGWVYQQLIKLSSHRLGSAPWMLLLDADTVLLRPQSFEVAGRWRVLHSFTSHRPYLQTAHRYFSELGSDQRGFVCEQFFLPRSVLAEVSQRLLGPQPTVETVAALGILRSAATFSEYELLGQYCLTHHAAEIEVSYYRNAVMSPTEYAGNFWKRNLFPLLFRTASFHVYAN